MADVKEGLPITPAVVQWARERAGYSLEDASLIFKKIATWEAGEALPSYAQLEDMADKFKTPVAVFFRHYPQSSNLFVRFLPTISPRSRATFGCCCVVAKQCRSTWRSLMRAPIRRRT